MTSAYALLGGAAGYAFGGPAGAAVGAAIGGGIDRNITAENIASNAQNFSAEQYATRYQTQVKDMEAAGLNPMLAYTQAPGPSPQGVTYNPINPYERAAADYSSAYNVERTGRNIEASTENIFKDIDVKDADIALKNSMTSLNEVQRSLVIASTDRIKQEIINLKSDNDRILALTQKLKIESDNLKKEGLNIEEQNNVLKATVQKLMVEVPYIRSSTFLNDARKVLTDVQVILTKAETNRANAQTGYAVAETVRSSNQADLIANEARLKGYDVAAAEKFQNFGREYKQYSGIIDLVKTVLSRK